MMIEVKTNCIYIQTQEAILPSHSFFTIGAYFNQGNKSTGMNNHIIIHLILTILHMLDAEENDVMC